MDPQRHLARTAGLSVDARAAFINLVNHAWLAGNSGETPASVPDDDVVLARISGLGPRWKKIRPEILQFFEAIDGRLVEKELQVVWIEQQEKHRRRVAAGQRGGRGRRGKQSESNAKALLKHSEQEQELKRSPFGGDALPALKLERISAPEDDASLRERHEVVAAWEIDHPDRASELRAKVAADFSIPLAKRDSFSLVARAQYENFVLAEIRGAVEERRAGHG